MNPNSQKYSKPIIVLGKGVPAYSRTYGCLTCCVAGVSEQSGWLRLYPLFLEPVLSSIKPVNKFDMIRVTVRQKHPEPNRPESRKILPEAVEIVDHIHDENARIKLLQRYTELGLFLHDDSWRGRKTLGMIKPLKKRFWITKENIPMVKFRCGPSCRGHTCEIGEYMKFNNVGRVVYKKRNAELAKHFLRLRNNELRFVMGTMRRRPHRWLLISIHVLGGN
jgi:hypothetical protein